MRLGRARARAMARLNDICIVTDPAKGTSDGRGGWSPSSTPVSREIPCILVRGAGAGASTEQGTTQVRLVDELLMPYDVVIKRGSTIVKDGRSFSVMGQSRLGDTDAYLHVPVTDAS